MPKHCCFFFSKQMRATKKPRALVFVSCCWCLCSGTKIEYHAFGKPCLCLRDSRHFVIFDALRFSWAWGAKPLFYWIECKSVIIAISSKRPLLGRGQRHGLPKASFFGFGKRVFFGKGVFSDKIHFLEMLENLEIVEILENPQTVENKGESDHYLENLEILEIPPVKRPLS